MAFGERTLTAQEVRRIQEGRCITCGHYTAKAPTEELFRSCMSKGCHLLPGYPTKTVAALARQVEMVSDDDTRD